jgi:hypothetical protein
MLERSVVAMVGPLPAECTTGVGGDATPLIDRLGEHRKLSPAVLFTAVSAAACVRRR